MHGPHLCMYTFEGTKVRMDLCELSLTSSQYTQLLVGMYAHMYVYSTHTHTHTHAHTHTHTHTHHPHHFMYPYAETTNFECMKTLYTICLTES